MRYERITVYQEHGDLDRKVYTFWLDEYKNQLVLDYYAQENRQTKRHKWVSQVRWSRLHSRETNIRREDITVPEDIKQMALNEFIRRITIE